MKIGVCFSFLQFCISFSGNENFRIFTYINEDNSFATETARDVLCYKMYILLKLDPIKVLEATLVGRQHASKITVFV